MMCKLQVWHLILGATWWMSRDLSTTQELKVTPATRTMDSFILCGSRWRCRSWSSFALVIDGRRGGATKSMASDSSCSVFSSLPGVGGLLVESAVYCFAVMVLGCPEFGWPFIRFGWGLGVETCM